MTSDEPASGNYEVPIYIEPDTWARIYAHARVSYLRGESAEMAYWDAVNKHITAIPIPVVDGVEKGPEDIDGLPPLDEDDDTIPAPFDEIPTIGDPSKRDREIAQIQYPPEAVPDEGPIPDPVHQHQESVEVTVPEWALEAATWRLGHGDGLPDPGKVESTILEYTTPHPTFVTEDGEDAVEAVLAELSDGEDHS